MVRRPMEGVRVLEVAYYGFVPSAGVVLADWGADVIKVENSTEPDPGRGIEAWGVKVINGFSLFYEVVNRNKRGVGLNLKSEEGLAVLRRLIAQADVFLTNFRGPARRKLKIEYEDVKAYNPRIIYGRGTGFGPRGPEADAGSFDALGYWSRSGASYSSIPAGQKRSIPQPGPGFGDVQGGSQLAGAIAAGLFQRERTGEGCVVDISLYSTGVWANQIQVTCSHFLKQEVLTPVDTNKPQNPLHNYYLTSDEREIMLALMNTAPYWSDFCKVTGREDLENDPRFLTHADRCKNAAACVKEFQKTFAEKPLAYWKTALAKQDGPWTYVTTPGEVAENEQAAANGMLQNLKYENGMELRMASAPTQFDGYVPPMSRGPEHGEHTEAVLLELGFEWSELETLKSKNAIL